MDEHTLPQLGTDLSDRVVERVASLFTVHAREAWDVREVALVTGLGVSTIWRWSETGEGGFPRARERGRKRFWLAAEVRDWLKKSPRVA